MPSTPAALYRHVRNTSRLESDIRQVRAELRAEVEFVGDEIARLRGLLEMEDNNAPEVTPPPTEPPRGLDVDSVEFELEARARGLTNPEILQLRAQSHAARAELEARLPGMARRIKRLSQ